MIQKTAPEDRAELGFFGQDSPLMNILMRTSAEELDSVNELIELQARQIGGRPIVVLPSDPDTIH